MLTGWHMKLKLSMIIEELLLWGHLSQEIIISVGFVISVGFLLFCDSCFGKKKYLGRLLKFMCVYLFIQMLHIFILSKVPLLAYMNKKKSVCNCNRWEECSWSWDVYRRMKLFVQQMKIDIISTHNYLTKDFGITKRALIYT